MGQQSRVPDRFLLSDIENRDIFTRWIADRLFANLTPVDPPTVHFFGGQPGAGKSSMQNPIVDSLRHQDGHESVAQVIGDEFRVYHPMYEKLLVQDDNDAAFYTDRDSAKWIEQSIDFVTNRQAHLVLEGTLRNPDVTLTTASLCKSRGYRAEMHVVATHEFISRTRIFRRYVAQIHLNGHGRYTLPESHKRAYDAIPASLEALAHSGQFLGITLYDANGKMLIRQMQDELDTSHALLDALARERTADNVDYEQLLSDIDELLAQLRGVDRPKALHDLEALKSEVQASREWP